MKTTTPALDRDRLLSRYRQNRERSRGLFGMIPDESWLDRPIPLRHAIVFYEGHLPAFNVNTLIRNGLGLDGVDPRFEILFERGIDPGSEDEANDLTIESWPSRTAVQAYGAATDRRIEALILEADLERDDRPAMAGGEALWTILEHEPMHHETLLYMFHALDPARKRMPTRSFSPGRAATSREERVVVPRGRARIGSRRSEIPFGWDNEFEAIEVDVPEFEIGAHNVTNGEFLQFVDAGGYDNSELWRKGETPQSSHPHFWIPSEAGWKIRTMTGEAPLPLDWPVWVTQDEASAFAQWKGMRLPTEAEYDRAAWGTPDGSERKFPWGDEEPGALHGNFDLRAWDPMPVGSFPAGRSAWGIEDLVGNGWEWTSTPFSPLPGFQPMASYPLYSAEFFDGEHYVLKGASPVTSRDLVRRSLRNWFRPDYPYLFASFRCVR
ncbi:MAG TPA: SUMF1/EgtB/PvdO family nonheme iron enzyme [Thermoanaerobaculia bacterium]|nr:SUMF1/EgtB/PvdO family nonheme iron enzyme [Thermoanaerobaculia bacterium]